MTKTKNQCIIQDETILEPIHIVPSWNPIDRNEKPPYSYATIIAHAILSSKERKLTLNEIYNWITLNYPFYCTTNLGWQNSVRHNLSLHKSFVKIDRDTSNPNHPRKGCYWTIEIGREQGFIDTLELPATKRTGKRRSSQNSTCSLSTPYPSKSSLGTKSSRRKYSIESCDNSVYTMSSSSPLSCDQDYYYQNTSIPPHIIFPFYRTSSVDNLFTEPYSADAIYSSNDVYSTDCLYPVSDACLYTSFYDNSIFFN